MFFKNSIFPEREAVHVGLWAPFAKNEKSLNSVVLEVLIVSS